MKILGLSGGFRQGYQDSAACLVVDGMVKSAIEEERLNRIKFSPGRLPFLSIQEIMRINNLQFSEIDCIAFHGETWGNEFQQRIEAYFKNHFGSCPKIVRYHHHNCHAASTYYASGFNNATVITYDNSGDGISLQIMKGENGKLSLIKRINRPDSLGLFYQIITQYCGFVKDSDEYKLMGLSSYGNRDKFNFEWLINFNEGELEINKQYIHVPKPGEASPHKDEMVYTKAFIEKIGQERRIPNTELQQYYKDVAASAQRHFEKLLIDIIKYYSNKTGFKKICIAGGSALNCVANQKIMNANFVDNLFVQPAAGDAGISLGAAWLCSNDYGKVPIKTSNTYLGNEYSDHEIEGILNTNKINYTYTQNPPEQAAKAISNNQVIGWFQGAMEFGPRALGNRSILASAINPKMQEIVNRKIKFRESYRPFCPSVLEEDVFQYFEGKNSTSNYMTITYNIKEEMKKVIPAVVHVDGTARIQTVSETQNKAFFDLLTRLKKLYGHGVVLNTSFNLSHEPIVCTPRDALATFFASGLDLLFLGNFIIKKSDN